MRLFACAVALLAALPLHADEVIRPDELKCSQGEGRTRLADISVTIIQKAEAAGEEGDFKTAPKVVLQELQVSYCFDEKKSGVERRQLESPVPLAAGFRLERVTGAGKQKVTSEVGSSSGFLGARFGFLDGQHDPGTSCDKGIACRRFYHDGPGHEATLNPLEFSPRQQCNPVVRGYAKGLIVGELKKLLPEVAVGDLLAQKVLCTEKVTHVPGSKDVSYTVYILAQAPLTK